VKIRVVWTGRKASFLYPVSPEPRTAVLARGFRASGNVRVFPQGWCEEAAAFHPAAIAGTRAQLTGLLGTPSISLTHALVVVLRPGEKLLTEGERERFWRAFGVPIFEQIVDRDGQLMASECEAHNGLHVDSVEVELKTFELEGYQLDEAPCGCGRKSPRLRAAGQTESERVAAYAR
jgi:hypothetical protein